MTQFQKNTWTNGRTERRRDPISQDSSSYHQGSSKYNCSRLAFKSQRYRVQCRSNQKLLHQSTVSMQKISSIHERILKIQLILGPHQIATPNFDYDHLKLIEITFNFQFISQFQSSVTRLAPSIFDHGQPKCFDQLSIYTNLYQHSKKSGYFISLICSGKTLQSDWLRIFWPISQEQKFPQM